MHIKYKDFENTTFASSSWVHSVWILSVIQAIWSHTHSDLFLSKSRMQLGFLRFLIHPGIQQSSSVMP